MINLNKRTLDQLDNVLAEMKMVDSRIVYVLVQSIGAISNAIRTLLEESENQKLAEKNSSGGHGDDAAGNADQSR